MKVTQKWVRSLFPKLLCGAGIGALMLLPAERSHAQLGSAIGGQAAGQGQVQTQPGVGGAVQRGVQETARGTLQGQRFGDAVRQGVEAGRQTLTDPQQQQLQQPGQFQQQPGQFQQQPGQFQQQPGQFQQQPGQFQQQPGQFQQGAQAQQWRQTQPGAGPHYLQPGQARQTAQAGWTGPALSPQSPYVGLRLRQADDGIRVTHVYPDSPAAQAGLQTGDIIRELDGQQVQSSQQLVQSLRGMEPGGQAALAVTRNGRQQDVQVDVGAFGDYQRGRAQAGVQQAAGTQPGDRAQAFRQDMDNDQVGRLQSRIQQLENQVRELGGTVEAEAEVDAQADPAGVQTEAGAAGEAGIPGAAGAAGAGAGARIGTPPDAATPGLQRAEEAREGTPDAATPGLERAEEARTGERPARPGQPADDDSPFQAEPTAPEGDDDQDSPDDDDDDN